MLLLLQKFGEIYFFFVENFIVGSVQEGNGSFGKWIFVIPPSDWESLPVVSKGLENNHTFPKSIVKLLTCPITFTSIGQAWAMSWDTFTARLDDIASEFDVDFAFLENLHKVTSTDFHKIFLKLQWVDCTI